MCKTFVGNTFAAIALALLLNLTVPPLARAQAAPVDIYGARQMAFNAGIQQIRKIELDDGVWEIKGWDVHGHRIEMKVVARSGAIVKLERH